MEKIRVLVVDDSLVVRRVVTEELEAQADIEVVGIGLHGQIALEKMAQLNPDLVILDIEMPEMDGLTALTHFAEAIPKTPVIMFSSLTELGAAATLEALSRAPPTSSPSPADQAASKPRGKSFAPNSFPRFAPALRCQLRRRRQSAVPRKNSDAPRPSRTVAIHRADRRLRDRHLHRRP